MGGNDGYTKLLLHCDGADESTTFTDDSFASPTHTVTVGGNAQIDTAQSVFGGASGLFDGSGDYLTVPDHDDWAFGTGDFTIDFRIRFNSLGVNECMFSPFDDGGSNRCFFSLDGSVGTALEFIAISGGSTIASFKTNNGVVTTNTWYHIALVRNGDNEYIFIDGTSQSLNYSTNPDSSTNYPNISSVARIGFQAFGWYIDGWIDEFRVSKGIARWTTNFTPPSAAYDTGDISISPSVLTITSSVQAPTIPNTAVFPSVLSITASVQAPTVVITNPNVTVTPSVISVTVSVQAPVVNPPLIVTPNVISITASLIAPTTSVGGVIISPSVFTVNANLQTPRGVGTITTSNSIKIVSVNPLVILSDTDPIEITRVTTTDPTNPTWDIQQLAGYSSPTDVAVNDVTNFIYISTSAGKVVKVNLNTLSSYSEIDVSDTDNLQSISTYSDGNLTQVSTDASTGEFYLIDENVATTLDTKFDVTVQFTDTLVTSFNCVEGFTIDTKFDVFARTTSTINTNLSVVAIVSSYGGPSTPDGAPTGETDINYILPYGREDWHVLINDVELADDDLDLRSIVITHIIGEETTAQFILARRHDQLNKNLAGTTSTITNQNSVKIYLGTNLEFNGNISNIDAIYAKSQEAVTITALATQPTERYDSITLPLPGLTEKRNLYHIILQNPQIYNPVVDADDDNPKKYKGIKVSLGERRKQSVEQNKSFKNSSTLAEDIIEDRFIPTQGWTYFWFAGVRKVQLEVESSTEGSSSQTTASVRPSALRNTALSGTVYSQFNGELSEYMNTQATIFQNFNKSMTAIFESARTEVQDILGFILPATNIKMQNYVGNSLSGLTTDLWELLTASYYNQKEKNDIIYRLGDGTIIVADIEDKVTGEGTNIFNRLSQRGYINGSGVIQEKFKNIQDFEEFDIDYKSKYSKIVFELLEDTLGYRVGEAPYREVSVRNGEFIPKELWVDKVNGMYREKAEGYNFTEYAQEVADLEYQKILNINGDILPITEVTLNLTLNAYYYYGIKLLNRINISNTTEPNIYNGNNGFPVSVKQIQLNSGNMQVTLDADNQKSSVELEAIDGEFPDENSDEYYDAGHSVLMFHKYDLQNNGARIE